MAAGGGSNMAKGGEIGGIFWRIGVKWRNSGAKAAGK